MDVTVEKKIVLAAYNVASKETKEVLEMLFGKDIFSPKDIKDRVKTYEDACKEFGWIPREFKGLKKDEIAYIKLKTIVSALNEGWVPDWKDSNQYKYWAWFNMSDLKEWYSRVVARSCNDSYTNGGVAYANADYYSTYTDSAYGSRLAFKSGDLAIYCGNQFAKLWAEYLLIL